MCGGEPAQSMREQHGEEIVNGQIVHSPERFPWLAWLGDPEEDGKELSQFCAGTLISDRIVLTAAHCLYEKVEKNLRTVVRVRVVNFGTEVGIKRRVVNWRAHKDFDDQMFNDIALLLLNESIPEKAVQPLPLSDGTEVFESAGNKTIVGWGSLDEACFTYDNVLREATVPLGTSGSACSTPGSHTVALGDDFDSSRELCAGIYTPDLPLYPGCGDSGGPLLAWEEPTVTAASAASGSGAPGANASAPGRWRQVGLTSWSYGAPYPDIFTRVSAFRDWINETSATLRAEGPRGKAKALPRAESGAVLGE